MENQELETLYITDVNTPKPPINTKQIRLYGHHNCPFVEKVRIALAAKNIEY